MIYLKSALFGLLTAFAAAVAWIFAVFVVPIVVPYLTSGFTGNGGAATADITSNSILAAALVGFILGFVWRLRRSRAST